MAVSSIGIRVLCWKDRGQPLRKRDKMPAVARAIPIAVLFAGSLSCVFQRREYVSVCGLHFDAKGSHHYDRILYRVLVWALLLSRG